jgi:hypothetical protein
VIFFSCNMRKIINRSSSLADPPMVGPPAVVDAWMPRMPRVGGRRRPFEAPEAFFTLGAPFVRTNFLLDLPLGSFHLALDAFLGVLHAFLGACSCPGAGFAGTRRYSLRLFGGKPDFPSERSGFPLRTITPDQLTWIDLLGDLAPIS